MSVVMIKNKSSFERVVVRTQIDRAPYTTTLEPGVEAHFTVDLKFPITILEETQK